jgi:SET domain-containing protein
VLLVSTRLGESPVHGIGLFAREAIPSGTIVWRFAPQIDVIISAEGLRQLADPAREQVVKYAYEDAVSGKLILCGDDARFINHSNDPNVIDDPLDHNTCVAGRDILPGQELFSDYYAFDRRASEKLQRTSHFIQAA